MAQFKNKKDLLHQDLILYTILGEPIVIQNIQSIDIEYESHGLIKPKTDSLLEKIIAKLINKDNSKKKSKGGKI